VQADAKEPKDNPRFVINQLKQSPQLIYEMFTASAAEIENRSRVRRRNREE